VAESTITQLNGVEVAVATAVVDDQAVGVAADYGAQYLNPPINVTVSPYFIFANIV